MTTRPTHRLVRILLVLGLWWAPGPAHHAGVLFFWDLYYGQPVKGINWSTVIAWFGVLVVAVTLAVARSPRHRLVLLLSRRCRSNGADVSRGVHRITLLRGVIALSAILSLSLSPAHAQTNARPPDATLHPLGEVHFILHGLLVQPPKGHAGPGHIQEQIFNRYRAATNTVDLATIGFRDGTVLHFNHNTDATFRSPTLTYIQRGVIEQILSPGRDHRVQTAAAVASAVGTDFGLEVSGDMSLFYVREGSLLVENTQGYVYVQNGQATTVVKGQAPKPSFSYDVVKALSWTKKLPPILPPPDTNLSLAANGGHVINVTSEDGAVGPAAAAIDGRLDRGWSSAPGQVNSQKLTVGFITDHPYLISAIVFSTQLFAQHPAAAMLQHFEILGSMTGTDDVDFQPITSGAVKQKPGLQRFDLPTPVDARYVQLVARDNFGDPQHLDVTEFEAIGHPDPDGSGTVVSPCTLVTPCVNATLGLVNSIRLQNNVPPLALSDMLNYGGASCTGALGHSIAMAQTQTLWHVNPRYPQVSYPHDVCLPFRLTRENIGTSNSGNEMRDIKAILALELREPHDPATCRVEINHACNIIEPKVTQIGIGLYFDRAGTWLTIILVG